MSSRIGIAEIIDPGKFVGAEGDLFSKLVVDAVQSVKMKNAEGKWKYPINQINIIRSHGKSSSESQLIADGIENRPLMNT